MSKTTEAMLEARVAALCEAARELEAAFHSTEQYLDNAQSIRIIEACRVGLYVAASSITRL